MRLTLVAPPKLVEQFGDICGNGYHIALHHLCRDHPAYLEFYRQKAAKGEDVILDNSVHETGATPDLVDLVNVALQMQPTTVVVPDRPYSSYETIVLAQQTIPSLVTALPGVKLMGVPHGTTFRGYLTCVSSLLKLGVDSVGMVRDCTQWNDDRAFMLAPMVYRLQDKQTLHLLGGERSLFDAWLVGAAYNAIDPCQRHRVVGCDTTKPAVYAYYGIKLPEDQLRCTYDWPGRPENYFELTTSDFDLDLVAHNFRVYERAFRGLPYD